MDKFSRLMTVLVVMMLTTTTTAGAQTPNDKQYEKISNEMVDIRGLELLKPINLTRKTRKELQKETISDLETDYPAVDRANDKRVLVAFGLLDPNEDLGELYGALLGEQIAGYYDPETDEMVVVSDDAPDADVSASDQATYAHEIVHALQDQHFDLEASLDQRMNGTDDESLAVTSLIEGDASAAQIEYLVSHPSLLLQLYDEISGSDSSTAALDNSPEILSKTLLFPYDQGQVFVTALRDDGGWPAVNKAFSSPPTTSEQILHPDKYLSGEERVEVKVPDVAAALGEGWSTFDTNTMGEFQTSILLDDGDVSSGDAEDAAAGWGGDGYAVVGTDDQTVILWNSVWDSDKDADVFASALIDRESGRLKAEAKTDGGTTVVTSDQGIVQVVIDGDSVSYIFAPDQATLDTVAAL